MKSPDELLDPLCPAPFLSEAVSSRDPLLCRAVAQNPNTPLELLQKLAEQSDKQTLYYLARNPNITLELLTKLLRQDPIAIQENPSVSLWLLEDPAFARVFSYDVVAALLTVKELNPNIVRSLLPSCYRSYANLPKLLEHPNAPFDLFLEIINKHFKHKNTRAYHAARNPNLPTHLVHFLLGNSSEVTRKMASKHANLDPNFFALAKQIGWGSQKQPDPTLTREDLLTLSVGGSYLRALVAKHPNATNEIFEQIVHGVDDPILFHVAAHPNTKHDVLVRLLKEKGVIIAGRIATRNDLTNELILLLTEKGGKETFLSLLRLAQLPAECFATFVKRGSVPVREAAAAHPDLPDALAQRLAFDKSEKVRAVLAKRKRLSPSLFEKLARDKNANVRSLIAKREDLPVNLRSLLASDSNPIVNQGASSPIYAELLSLLNGLSNDEKYRLSFLPGTHPIISKYLLGEAPPAIAVDPLTAEKKQQFFALLQSPTIEQTIFESMMPYDDPLLRRAMLRHPGAPLVLLLSAAITAKSGELLAMYRNPALPPVLREYVLKKYPSLTRVGPPAPG
jgi:hypothetical protein